MLVLLLQEKLNLNQQSYSNFDIRQTVNFDSQFRRDRA
jgi:hypothetical protein